MQQSGTWHSHCPVLSIVDGSESSFKGVYGMTALPFNFQHRDGAPPCGRSKYCRSTNAVFPLQYPSNCKVFFNQWTQISLKCINEGAGFYQNNVHSSHWTGRVLASCAPICFVVLFCKNIYRKKLGRGGASTSVNYIITQWACKPKESNFFFMFSQTSIHNSSSFITW